MARLRRRWLIPLLAASAVLMAAAPGRAAFSIGLNQTYTGTSPSGAAPWLTATFTQQDAHTVRLTLTSNLHSATEFVADWYFNLNPALNAGSLTFSQVSLGNVGIAPTIGAANNAFDASAGAGDFDILFDFSTANSNGGANRFRQGSQVVYDISLVGGLSENDFNFQSANSNFLPAPISAAHVQGVNGNDSGKIMYTVPAPAGLVLVASGLPLLLFALLRRQRPAVA